MSRKTTLSKTVISMAYDLFKEGHYVEDVAEYLGINSQTYYNWMNRGEEIHDMDDKERVAYFKSLPNATTKRNAKLYLEFYDTVKKAQLEAKMGALRNIRNAGKKSWQADAWFLERRYRQQFGRITILEDSGGGGESGEGTLSKLIKGIDAAAQQEAPQDTE